MIKLYRLLVLLMLLLGFVKQSNVVAQTSVAQAQSHFIYNFTRYLDWPVENKTGDFVIGVYGGTDVYNELKEYVVGKNVNAQAIKLKIFSKSDDITKCHILFVGLSKTKEISSIKNRLGNSKTCLITEKEGAIQDGSEINFVIVNDKLKYEISTSNLQRAGLKYSSTLESMGIAK